MGIDVQVESIDSISEVNMVRTEETRQMQDFTIKVQQSKLGKARNDQIPTGKVTGKEGVGSRLTEEQHEVVELMQRGGAG